MIFGKPIEYPPAPFQPGDYVIFRFDEDRPGRYRVLGSCHTHTQLEGFAFATLNWELKRVHKATQKATGESRKRDRKDRVTIDSKKPPTSENPLKDTRP